MIVPDECLGKNSRCFFMVESNECERCLICSQNNPNQRKTKFRATTCSHTKYNYRLSVNANVKSILSSKIFVSVFQKVHKRRECTSMRNWVKHIYVLWAIVVWNGIFSLQEIPKRIRLYFFLSFFSSILNFLDDFVYNWLGFAVCVCGLLESRTRQQAPRFQLYV